MFASRFHWTPFRCTRNGFFASPSAHLSTRSAPIPRTSSKQSTFVDTQPISLDSVRKASSPFSPVGHRFLSCAYAVPPAKMTTSNSYLAAIDQGTTSSRFMVFTCEGEIVAYHQKEFTQINPQAGYVWVHL
jgi:hypothetical protein